MNVGKDTPPPKMLQCLKVGKEIAYPIVRLLQPRDHFVRVLNLERSVFCNATIPENFLELQKKLPKERRNIIFPVILHQTKIFPVILQSTNDFFLKELNVEMIRERELLSAVAADARYHQKCHKKLFYRPNTTGQKRGRPKVESVQQALETRFVLGRE